MLTALYNGLQLCADRVIPEKAGHPEPPCCAIISGTITGDSKMSKRIPLTQGKFAIVDDEDYGYLNKWNWHVEKKRNGMFYATRRQGKSSIAMHQQILNTPKGMETDHRNHNGLDNKRSNIRICTYAQNQQNRRPRCKTSKYKGVSWSKTAKKWLVHIVYNKKALHLGLFNDELKAAKVYDENAKKLFGEFAYINF